jgi:heptosyltransferase-2
LKSFLIIQTASLGDVILATPIVEKLHHFFPDARIDFLLKDGYQPLLRNHPYISNVLAWDKSENKYRQLKELIQFVREQQYDIVINVQRFASTGLIAALSGARQKIGFNKNPLSFLFTRKVKHIIDRKGNIHEIDRNLKLIEHLTDDQRFPVRLYPSKKDDAKMSQFKTRAYITVSPGCLWFTKMYPEEKWVEFISELDDDLQVYFLGSAEEKELCNRIMKNSGHKMSMNLAGRLSFLESAVLMRDAQMNYVNDSAPMHLSSSVNAPVTAIYCSTVPEFGFGPLSDKSFIVQTKKNLSCKPCGLHGLNSCPEKHFECAYTIEKEQLLEKI